MRLKSGRVSPVTKTLKFFFSTCQKNIFTMQTQKMTSISSILDQFTIFREFVSLVFTWDLQPAKQSPEAPPTHVSS